MPKKAITTAKELREERVRLTHEAREIIDNAEAEGRDLTAEEDQRWETLHNASEECRTGNQEAENAALDFATEGYEAIEARDKRRADRLARQHQVESDLDSLQTHGIDLGRHSVSTVHNGNLPRDITDRYDEEDLNLIGLAVWACHGKAEFPMTPELEAIAVNQGYRLGSSEINVDLGTFAPCDYNVYVKELKAGEIRMAQSSQQGSGGGFLLGRRFRTAVEEALLQFGGMLRVAEVVRTATGEPFDWPTDDDTSNTGELIGENTAVNEQDVEFGQITMRSYNFSSKMVRVPFTLLRDSIIDLALFIGRKLGTRLGRIVNTKLTVGTGNAQPLGLATAATTGVTAASATAIAADELYDLKHSVDPAYREMSPRWMFNDSTLKAIKKLKDGNGRYLWQPSLAGGTPETIDDDPFTINQDMASIATTNKSILYGALQHYKVRQVATMRLRRLDERYAEYDQVAFLAFLSLDGNLIDAGTNPVKALVQA